MTRDEATRLLDEYRAGIDAELNLLRQLAEVARQQREVTAAGDFQAFHRVADRRDAIMQSLVTIEEGLRSIRQTLAAHRDVARQVDGYDAVVARHREATLLVGEILATDQQSMSALADAELARRSAIASLERGETTLAAYRRVLAPPAGHARLVDKIG
ncbi:MAG: hypothetical protein DIU54_004785 [Acidobacteriota bacterium]|nr:MAG: hypothetical protein DIU54_05990 [Acidobacteriota bacterium]